MDRGRAALRHTVIGGRRIAEWRAGIVDLVVADEDDAAVRPLERAHPVVATGKPGAVVEHHGRLRVVEGSVLEPLRQPQPNLAVPLVGDRAQAAERRLAARSGGKLHEALERTAECGHPRRGCDSLQECPPVHSTHAAVLHSSSPGRPRDDTEAA
jgi:hypothetical protein